MVPVGSAVRPVWHEPALSSDERNAFEAGSLVARCDEVAGTNTCSTFHPQSCVRAELARGLEMVDFRREGVEGNPHRVYMF